MLFEASRLIHGVTGLRTPFPTTPFVMLQISFSPQTGTLGPRDSIRSLMKNGNPSGISQLFRAKITHQVFTQMKIWEHGWFLGTPPRKKYFWDLNFPA